VLSKLMNEWVFRMSEIVRRSQSRDGSYRDVDANHLGPIIKFYAFRHAEANLNLTVDQLYQDIVESPGSPVARPVSVLKEHGYSKRLHRMILEAFLVAQFLRKECVVFHGSQRAMTDFEMKHASAIISPSMQVLRPDFFFAIPVPEFCGSRLIKVALSYPGMPLVLFGHHGSRVLDMHTAAELEDLVSTTGIRKEILFSSIAFVNRTLLDLYR
jgi:hypothetical protein